jgi:hypothetical protein
MANEIDHYFWAKTILKYLVNRVRNYDGTEKSVAYSDLAQAINYPIPPAHGNKFSKQIGKTLGVLGHSIEKQVVDGEEPPYIQALVVGKTDGIPGNGIREFYPDYPNLPRHKKRDWAVNEYERVMQFGERWEKLLDQLGIDWPEEKPQKLILDRRKYNPYGSEGSPEHRELRDFVFEHPEFLEIELVEENARWREYALKSGDSVDVMFASESGYVGVEVKSRRSGPDDIERGLYQCVKYKAVLAAENLFYAPTKTAECVLVLESSLPDSLKRTRDKLNIKVIENINPGQA